MQTLFKFIFVLPMWLIGIILQVWSVGALYFRSFPSHEAWRPKVAIAYAIVIVLIWLFHKFRLKGLMISMIFYVVVLMWFHALKPITDGVYPDHLRAAHAEINGNYITVHNVRNCEYRSKDDFDVRYAKRTYDIRNLEAIDIFVSSSGMDVISDTFLSFVFSDGKYLCVSVEVRPEVGEMYDMLQGMFKEYEIIYVWADERDLVRMRTYYEQRDVYLYRLQNTDKRSRERLFLHMFNQTNQLRIKPRFYNTLMHDCAYTLLNTMNETGLYDIPVWKQCILSVNIDRSIYNEGFLNNNVPFEELRQEAFINDRAMAADKEVDFSERIRTHL